MADKKKTNTPAPKQAAKQVPLRKPEDVKPRPHTRRMDAWSDGPGECAGAD